MSIHPELVHAAILAAVGRHGIPLSSADIEKIVDAVVRSIGSARPHFPPHPGSPLNTREIEIVAGIARGSTNKEMACSLGLSPFTVKSHLNRITARVGERDRAGLVGLAYREGWLTGLPAEPREAVELKPDHLDVLEGMAHGRSNAEIAERLVLSEEAVRSRARGLFEVLRARTRAHAVALGYQHGHLVAVPRGAGTATSAPGVRVRVGTVRKCPLRPRTSAGGRGLP
ncbi:hypothetical protein GCM10023205_63860 [Yinghuangia aomiensis]|uniref:HTH luxR-type domain-containing protein n=1 Tax=Yinghuangia aomiensis TaxID=676205 RepID=A0ABP9I2D7_9ACTN